MAVAGGELAQPAQALVQLGGEGARRQLLMEGQGTAPDLYPPQRATLVLQRFDSYIRH